MRPEASRLPERVELSLLSAAVRPAPDAVALKHLAGRIEDWNAFMLATHRHGVTPLVYRRLREYAADQVPSEVIAELRAQSRRIAGRNLALMRELLALADLLDPQSVLIMPLRGPALAATLYGDSGLRECVDLDILVRKPELETVEAALCHRGFRPARVFTPSDRTLWLRRSWECCYVRDDGLYIEPHWEPLPRTHPCGVDANLIWRDARPANLEGRAIAEPAPEHAFLLLCAHAAKHGWDQLKAVADVAWSLKSLSLDDGRLPALARATGTFRAVAVSCWLARELLGAAAPRWPCSRRDEHLIESIGNSVIDAWLKPRQESLDLRDWLFRLRVLERARDKIAFLTQACFVPNTNDTAAIRLPRLLSPLYYPLHTFRLALKYGLRPIVTASRSKVAGERTEAEALLPEQ